MEETLTTLKKLGEKPQTPVMFADAKARRLYDDAYKGYKQRSKDLVSILEKAMGDTNADPAYQLVKRFFREITEHRLDTEAHDDFKRIFEQAKSRLLIGNPPRKMKSKEPQTIGDAINWEWCLEQCRDSPTNDLVVISRDSDYGISLSNRMVPNTMLVEEFKRVVSQKRRVVLTDKIGDALRLLEVDVSKQQIREEAKEVAEISPKRGISGTFYTPPEVTRALLRATHSKEFSEQLESFIRALRGNEP